MTGYITGQIRKYKVRRSGISTGRGRFPITVLGAQP
jgi:hypothetical protein